MHDKATRSYNIGLIRTKNTKPGMLVRKFLHAQGFRYTLHNKKTSGKPEIVFPKHKTIVFIHGCSWLRHKNSQYFVVPKTRTEWWVNKINSNKANDEKAMKALRKEGWRIINLWECDLKSAKVEWTFKKLLRSF